MKNELPALISSYTPVPRSYKDIKPSRLRLLPYMMTSKKIYISSLNESPARVDSLRPVINSSPLPEKKRIQLHRKKINIKRTLRKLDEIDAKNQRKDRVLCKYRKTENSKYYNIAESLLSITSQSPDSFTSPASSIAQLFIALEYTKDFDSLTQMFLNAFNSKNFNTLEISTKEIVDILEDFQVDDNLRPLLKELKNCSVFSEKYEFDELILILKKWWVDLDPFSNGYVSLDSVFKFFSDIGAIEDSVNCRKLSGKLPRFFTMKRFYSVFSKSLFKFLILNLLELTKNDTGYLPADIIINTSKRKKLMGSIVGDNKVVQNLIAYNNRK